MPIKKLNQSVCFIIVLVMFQCKTFAATRSTNVTSTANVTANCQLSSGSLAFGSYDPISTNASTPLLASGVFNISCTKGAVATISLNNGLNSAQARGTTRAMAAGSNYLSYEIYTTSARNTVWNTTQTVSYVSLTKNTTPQTVWGSIPAGQDVRGGLNYNDTVIITATF